MDNVHFKKQGKGPVILFVHGWMASHEVWRDLINVLKDEYTCIAIDLPGFGKSMPLKGENLIAQQAKIVADFLSQNKIRPDAVISHSLGGIITYKLFINGKISPKYIAFLSVPFKGVKIFRKFSKAVEFNKNSLRANARIAKKFPYFSKIVALLTVSKWELVDDRINKWAIQADAYSAAKLFEEVSNFSTKLKKLPNAKVLVTRGENELIVSRADLAQQKKAFSAKMHEFPNISHTPMLECSEKLLDAISDFLEG